MASMGCKDKEDSNEMASMTRKKKNPLVELKFDQAHLPYLLSHYWADKMPLEELAVVRIIKHI